MAPMDNAALERRAREVLADEYERNGFVNFSAEIRRGNINLAGVGMAFRAAVTLATEMREACAKDGWVMVPRVPTDDMMQAGVSNNPTMWTEDTDRGFARDVAESVWSAMIAAAPDASQALPTIQGEG